MNDKNDNGKRVGVTGPFDMRCQTALLTDDLHKIGQKITLDNIDHLSTSYYCDNFKYITSTDLHSLLSIITN